MPTAPREPLGRVLIGLALAACGVFLYAQPAPGGYRDPGFEFLYVSMIVSGFVVAVVSGLLNSED